RARQRHLGGRRATDDDLDRRVTHLDGYRRRWTAGRQQQRCEDSQRDRPPQLSFGIVSSHRASCCRALNVPLATLKELRGVGHGVLHTWSPDLLDRELPALAGYRGLRTTTPSCYPNVGQGSLRRHRYAACQVYLAIGTRSRAAST